MSANWRISGTYFESCNCETACPCVFLSAPTDGECKVLVGWHIDEGHFDGVSLNDLNVAMAAHSPGHMLEVPWKGALYFDDEASLEQRDALQKIFAGQAGGHFERLISHVGEVLGVTAVPIDYQANGKKRSMKVGSVADVAIQAMEGQGGEDVTITGHPLCIAPGIPSVLGRSEKLTYQDHGYTWEFTDKNGFYSPFVYTP